MVFLDVCELQDLTSLRLITNQLSRNIPIGAVVLLLIFVFLRLQDSKEKVVRTLSQQMREMDLIGMVCIIASVTSLLLAIQWGGQTLPWDSPTVIGLLVGAALIFIMFMGIQWKIGDHATLPFSILKQRSIAASALYIFAFAMPTYAVGYD